MIISISRRKCNNLSNNSNSISSNDNRKIPYGTKHLFITEEIRKKDHLEEDNKIPSINDNNNNIIIKKQKNIIQKDKNKDFLTPNNLLYPLDNENININILPKNIQNDNYILVEKMCEQIKNYKNNNDIKINNSNNINPISITNFFK